MGIFHPRIIFGCAFVHLGYLTSAFVFSFDRENNKLTEVSAVFPPAGHIRFDRNPEKGICSYKSLWGKIQLNNHLSSGMLHLDTSMAFPGKSITADIVITTPKDEFSPMHFLMPMNNNNKAFTTKAAGLCAQGQISINRKGYKLSVDNTHAVFDWTNGFYPRSTFWNWACSAGISKNSSRIGFNLSSGVYEYGQLENTVWVNGKPQIIGPVIFSYDRKHPDRPWQIQSLCKTLDLSFIPEGARQANDNFGFIQSRFYQGLGSFEGQINLPDFSDRIEGFSGVTEEHHARW